MATRARKQALLASNAGLTVNLFPFISIFLCVMGVLSFLNLINSAGGARALTMHGDLVRGDQVAYQVLTMEEGMVLIPPVDRLSELIDLTNGAARQQLQAILLQRQRARRLLGEQLDKPHYAAQALNQQQIRALFEEVEQVNRLASQAGLLREDFVLFGIYPGGGGSYHRMRQVMLDNQTLMGVRIGLEPLDSSWKLTLDPANRAVE